MSREPTSPNEKQVQDNVPAPDLPAQQEKKTKPDWRANEQQVLPENNLPLVFFGLMASVFLSALDQVGHYVYFSDAARLNACRPLCQPLCLP